MNATTNITEIENFLYFTGNLVFSFINGSMQMVNIGQNYTKDDFETLVRDKSSKGR